MDAKLKSMFEDICKLNDELMKIEEELMPVFFIINKDYSMQIIACPFTDDRQKEKAKNVIMKMIAKSELLGYISILDTNMTMMAQDKTEQNSVKEVCLRNLYTKDEVVRDWVIHEGTKVLEKFDTSMFDKAGTDWQDQWNFWNRKDDITKDEEKMNKDYFEFKKNNPKLYK